MDHTNSPFRLDDPIMSMDYIAPNKKVFAFTDINKVVSVIYSEDNLVGKNIYWKKFAFQDFRRFEPHTEVYFL